MTTTQYQQLLYIIQKIESSNSLTATNVSLFERLARDLETIASASDVNYNKDPFDRIYQLFLSEKVFFVFKDQEAAA